MPARRHAGQSNLSVALGTAASGNTRAAGVPDARWPGPARVAAAGTNQPAVMARPYARAHGGARARPAGVGSRMGSAGRRAVAVGPVVAASTSGAGSHGPKAPARVGTMDGQSMKPRTVKPVRYGTAGTRARTGTGTGTGTSPRVDTTNRGGVSTRNLLLSLATDPNAASNARASAARSLAEMDGLIGRHQSKPNQTADVPVEELSRTELAQELARLRARCLPESLS